MVLNTYRQRVAQGLLKPDPLQERVAEKLEQLCQALVKPNGWWARFKRSQQIKGLYIYGDVGRGKSMLMDLFFQAAPAQRKRRVHFHAFMLEVHQRLHTLRQQKNIRDPLAPLAPLAQGISQKTTLLCFDEFHVTDVADAMILSRLFTELFDQGVVVAATSNWPPDDLYKDGLQRQLFLPFIDLIKRKMDVLALTGGTDYRLDRLQGLSTYFFPLDKSTGKMAEVFSRLTDNSTFQIDSLNLGGRTLAVPRSAKGVAWFTFHELCGQPLGAADYLALATHYSTVLVDSVPRLTDDLRNETKRFMILIDALYEHRTKVIIAADAAPEKLYLQGRHAFEFQRTVSRLMEMQAVDYLHTPHVLSSSHPESPTAV